MGLIGFATDLTEHERAKDELKRYRDRLAELVEQQIDELKATNEYLQREIAQHEQDLKRQTSELTTVNEQLQDQISKQEQAKNELQEYQDRLEQRVKEQSDELTAASEQLQHEIAKRKQVEECLKQKADELKTASERLQGLINEMRARGPFSQAAVSEATGSRKTTASILVDVFRQNIALQKPELDDAAVNEGTI